MTPHLAALRADPRQWQIAALGTLLAVGVTRLQFDITPGRIGLLLASALAAQWACGRLARQPRFEPRSALISALSLCLLLRTNDPWLAAAAAVAAIGSKYAIRV